MTHFGVAVFTEHGVEEEIAKLMAPYNEQPVTPEERAACRREIGDEVDVEDYPGRDDAWFEKSGFMRNAENKWCYVRHPDAKWDYWRAMGWEVWMPKGGIRAVSHIQLGEIDVPRTNQERDKKLAEAWKSWCQLRDTGEEPDKNSWKGERGRFLDWGLITCLDETQLTDEHKGMAKHKWPRQLQAGIDRYDVYLGTTITEAEFLERFKHAAHPWSTWAYLDEEGWHEPGKMGWWAISHETPDDLLAHKRKYIERVMRGIETAPKSYVTAVDCHI